MNANIRTIGGSIGTALMASIVTAHYLPSGFPKEIGYTAGFVVLGATPAGCGRRRAGHTAGVGAQDRRHHRSGAQRPRPGDHGCLSGWIAHEPS
ncbi:hypothetical protein [Aeromicrobium sp. UC242_57]|uniref:hypothetical protein n=1 Tax=Aeromicrobium sp. UC242_57 TaxID=3374624 RepID=UPI00378E4C95